MIEEFQKTTAVEFDHRSSNDRFFDHLPIISKMASKMAALKKLILHTRSTQRFYWCWYSSTGRAQHVPGSQHVARHWAWHLYLGTVPGTVLYSTTVEASTAGRGRAAGSGRVRIVRSNSYCTKSWLPVWIQRNFAQQCRHQLASKTSYALPLRFKAT